MRAIYLDIYRDLRDKIVAGTYPYQGFVPPESKLVRTYSCSHNTVRKALALLAREGFVQPIQGRGVRVIWRPERRANFRLGRPKFETYAEVARSNGLSMRVVVHTFEQVTASGALQEDTGFSAGTRLWHIERVRLMDGQAVFFDINYFLVEALPDLTRTHAEGSVYAYAEQAMGFRQVASRQVVSVERATPRDRELMDLHGYPMVAQIAARARNERGVQFDATFSRLRPDFFEFRDTAFRHA